MKNNIALTIILMFVGIVNSFACSCEGESNVSESLAYSDVVFSGQVISISVNTNYDSLGVVLTGDSSKMMYNWREYPTYVVKFKVDRIFKGEITTDTITILTPPSGAACGYRFKFGEKYIVYSTLYDELLSTNNLKRRTFDNKTFWTHLCTRTQIWNVTEENEILNMCK